MSRTFIIDTNVILYDCKCINKFKDNDIIIPIPVLEEIDKFKSGMETIHYNAREFVRDLNLLSEKGNLIEGINNKDGGSIKISRSVEIPSFIKKYFFDDTMDHRILAIAYEEKKKNKKKDVVIISKDVNLRMKALSVGLNAEDYENSKIEDISVVLKNTKILSDKNNIVDEIYNKKSVEIDAIDNLNYFNSNDYAIINDEYTQKKSILVHISKSKGKIFKVKEKKCSGISAKNIEQKFAIDALLNPDIKIVVLSGGSGCGKTLLALAAAIEQIDKYYQIYLARPNIPLSNKDLGYLPGDVNHKIEPYMQPLFDNLAVIKEFSNDTEKKYIEDIQKNNKLVISPLAYIRGRSLSNVFFIIDEAQNLTPHEIKTIVTRAGNNAKFIFTGDVNQIDTPHLDKSSNGMSHLIDKLKNESFFTHINLLKGERSELSDITSKLL